MVRATENPIIMFIRSWSVVLIVLPLSMLWSFIERIYRVYSEYKRLPMRHMERVQRVQSQVLANTQRRPMATARPGWHSMSLRVGKYKSTSHLIDMHDLDNVLEINHDMHTIVVEPLVSVGQLTEYLVNSGYTLACVPELDDLTIGGLLCGFGVESSSHKYGLIQNIVKSVELVVPDGSVVVCSADNDNSELFEALPWSHGTLGFVTSIELQLVPSKTHVRLEYEVFDNMTQLSMELQRPQSCEFLEALVYSPSHAVLMRGTFTNVYSSRVNHINRFWKPWFYEHVRSMSTGSMDTIPLRDYYHRHTRSLFWAMQDIIPFGNQWWFRWIFGWMGTPKVGLLKLTSPRILLDLYEKHQMHQDFLVPMKDLDDFLSVLHEQVQFYPLWICPMKLWPSKGLVSSPSETREPTMYVDVGVYGAPEADTWNARRTTRAMEEYVRDHQGYQALYADTYQSREEFYRMFNHDLYDKQRSKYKCDGLLPTIYDKVNKLARQ